MESLALPPAITVLIKILQWKVLTLRLTVANGINPNPLFNFIHPETPVIKDRSLLGEISIPKSGAIHFKTNAGHQYVIVTT